MGRQEADKNGQSSILFTWTYKQVQHDIIGDHQLGEKSKSKRATILQLRYHLFHPSYGSEVHLAARLCISQPLGRFRGQLPIACCILSCQEGDLSQNTVSRWTPPDCKKGLCGACRSTAVAARLETISWSWAFLLAAVFAVAWEGLEEWREHVWLQLVEASRNSWMWAVLPFFSDYQNCHGALTLSTVS